MIPVVMELYAPPESDPPTVKNLGISYSGATPEGSSPEASVETDAVELACSDGAADDELPPLPQALIINTMHIIRVIVANNFRFIIINSSFFCYYLREHSPFAIRYAGGSLNILSALA